MVKAASDEAACVGRFCVFIGYDERHGTVPRRRREGGRFVDSSDPRNLFLDDENGVVYFAADDGAHGVERRTNLTRRAHDG